jgi:hypothetical protein
VLCTKLACSSNISCGSFICSAHFLSALQSALCTHPSVLHLVSDSSTGKAGKSVVFCCILATLVYLALRLLLYLIGSLMSDWALGIDIHAFFHHAVLSPWQDECTNTQGNKLCMVKPSVQLWHSTVIRKEKVMFKCLW